MFQFLAFCSIAILTFLPLGHILQIVFSTGTNVVSNDLAYYTSAIDQFLSGTYNFTRLFSDSFSGSHIMAIPLFIRLIVAYFSHWNIYWEITIGIFLFVCQLFLLHDSLTRLSYSSWLKWLLLPLLSCLIFSTVHINIFTFGETCLALGFVSLGVNLGIWGLTRFSPDWTGILILGIGGIIAAWSWGVGVMFLPVSFLGLFLFGDRKILSYCFLSLTSSIALSPYIFHLLLRGGGNSKILTFFNFPLLIKAIGLPFGLGKQSLIGIGFYGTGTIGFIFLLVIFLFVWLRRSREFIKPATPALMILAFALLSLWQITSFRDDLAPWYVTPFMNFWLGILGLAYILYLYPQARAIRKKNFFNIFTRTKSAKIYSSLIFFSLTYFYLMSGITYQDKVFYLSSRIPAAAACLQSYKTAPTYCEEHLFQAGYGDFTSIQKLAEPLEKHQLSVFSSQQTRTLQGDFILDTVRLQDVPDRHLIYWSSDFGKTVASWQDYRHLNLVIPSSGEVKWSVNIPQNAREAIFHSAIALPNSQSSPVSFAIEIESDNGHRSDRIVKILKRDRRSWYPLSIPLTQYSGQTLSLHFQVEASRDNSQALGIYRYPFIDLSLQANKNVEDTREVIPSNTDLSLTFPAKTSQDFKFNSSDRNLWKIEGLAIPQPEINSTSKWFVESLPPSLEYNSPLNLCWLDYDYFSIDMAISPAIYPQTLKVDYRSSDRETFHKDDYFKIPLIADGQIHGYTYKIRLLDLEKETRLAGIKIHPFVVHGILKTGDQKEKNWVKITDIRFLHRKGKTFCQ
ncbi:MAG: hypothetical protein J7647_27470 [Cyanobacteria bacterium SBLK]|nr:hypothetical protein [Cyanobacteria bacterium SBLK]